ncbi:MAG: alpha/beta hydrolase, partial [Elusimicrobia bacterium]|nr:alpha/beta hydrolase [Elusimicrobiota bacterium]
MEIRAVKFRVGHEWRVGGLYRPSDAGSTPAVLMLHGFPGIQKNDDIAAELCRRGMTAFTPHFRGCWGSAGRYSLRGLLEDARAAL